MAFIAGYIAERPKPIDVIRERVRAFSILPGESGAADEQAVIALPFGHLIIKHKATHPIRPRIATDAEGNALATLGYVLSGEDAKGLLSASARTAARSLEECEGEFVAVFADATTGAVHIVNDRFSARPFYTLRSKEGVYFSSNLTFLLELAQTPYHPDVIGWLETCTASHTFGTRTTAQGIERLRPGTHLTISSEAVTERQYWRLEHRPDTSLDPSKHSAEVFEAFRAGTELRARLVGRGILALSGGLDSRLVAGALPRDTNYSAFTFVDKAGADSTPQTSAAAAVSAALGLRHHIEALPSRFTRPSEVIALTGGMRPYQDMAIVMSYIEEMRRQGEQVLLGGGPGDVLAGSYVPSPDYLDPGRTSECVENTCQRRLAFSRNWALVFRDDVIESNRQAVQDALAASFGSITGPTAAHRVTAWAMVFRQPAFTFTSVLHTHPDATEAVCHLGYRYTDLMLQLPASWLYKRAFYSFMIYHALPQLRHVPYANTGRLLTGEPPLHRIPREPLGPRALELAQSFGRRVVARIARSIVPAHAVAPSLLFRDTALVDEVKECVHSIPYLRDILDAQRCDDFLARTRAGACPSEEVMGVLTSLCLSSKTLRK
jgi:hypothetical protein